MSDSDSPLPGAGTNAGVNDQLEPNDSPAPIGNNDMDMDLSENEDNESDLSEVDEAEFADFDPTTVALDDRPAAIIDENIAKSLKAVRKTTSGEKKPKPAKREKKKKTRRNSNEGVEAANEIEGKRRTKGPRAEGGESQQKTKTKAPPVPLTEEDQKEFELDAIINAATKGSKRRKKQDDIDLEQAFDEEIAALKIRMEQACEADNTARERGEPAIHKLKMLPEVVSLLNRNTVQDSIVDPDTNFLQAVKFFLEPLSDGSLPAYNIQRDLFNALARLPIEKEALLSSGIGKVVLYYTKTKRPEIGIKRIAERLLGEWSRPILKRSDDYKKRKIEHVDYDPNALVHRPLPEVSPGAPAGPNKRQLERIKALAAPVTSNRARIETPNNNFTVAPRTNLDPNRQIDPNMRPIGAGGDRAFLRMTQKNKKRG